MLWMYSNAGWLLALTCGFVAIYGVAWLWDWGLDKIEAWMFERRWKKEKYKKLGVTTTEEKRDP